MGDNVNNSPIGIQGSILMAFQIWLRKQPERQENKEYRSNGEKTQQQTNTVTEKHGNIVRKNIGGRYDCNFS